MKNLTLKVLLKLRLGGLIKRVTGRRRSGPTRTADPCGADWTSGVWFFSLDAARLGAVCGG